MSELKDLLKTDEKVDMPIPDKGVYAFLRIMTWIIVGVVVIGSLIFESNLLNEMSWTTRILFFGLVINNLFRKKKKEVPSPLEILFYNDYFVVYRPKRYYSRKVTYREFNKFYYSDVGGMDYDLRTHRFNIHGKIDATFFKYDKDGNLPNEPCYHKITDGGICYFYIINNDADNIISTMEQYVGQKVSFRNQAAEQSQKQGFKLGTSDAGCLTTDCNDKIPEDHK